MILFKNIFLHIFSFFLMFILILLLVVVEIDSKTVVKRGIMDDLGRGIKYAGQIMGINTAADVANLVSKAFSNQNIIKKHDEIITSDYSEERDSYQQPGGKDDKNTMTPALLISGLLKMMGFDGGKLGALALNGIIMIAQMIGSALMPRFSPTTENRLGEKDGTQQQQSYSSEKYDENHSYTENYQPRKERRARDGTPLDWILEDPSEELSTLLNKIRDKNLPNYLSETVDKLEQNKGDGDCIKMLICKSAPFVWGMQRNIGDRIDGTQVSDEEEVDENRVNTFFKYLPDVQEYRNHEKFCEKKYSKCNPKTRKM